MKAIGMMLLIGVLTGCAADVNVAYPFPQPEAETGTVVVKFTTPIQQVHVKIDGELLVQDEYTERVTIERVPAGEREMEIAASESSLARPVHVRRTVLVRPDRTETVLIPTPPPSVGYWVFRAAMVAAYAWTYAWWLAER